MVESPNLARSADWTTRDGRDGRSGPDGRRAPSASASATNRRTRVVVSALCGAVPALLAVLLISTLAGGGHAKSVAGISLDPKLSGFTVAAVPLVLAIAAAALKWSRITPLGLTWGYGAVAGLSWLALLWLAQVAKVTPHLLPYLTVPLLVGGAFAAGAALTDESTGDGGRYACLAGVIASHLAIVAIAVKLIVG